MRVRTNTWNQQGEWGFKVENVKHRRDRSDLDREFINGCYGHSPIYQGEVALNDGVTYSVIVAKVGPEGCGEYSQGQIMWRVA